MPIQFGGANYVTCWEKQGKNALDRPLQLNGLIKCRQVNRNFSFTQHAIISKKHIPKSEK